MSVETNGKQIFRATAPTLRFTLLTPQDVTGWTTQLIIRRGRDGAALLTVTGNTVSVGTGVFTAALTKAQTLSLASGDYYFTFQRTNTGSEDLLAHGALTVRPGHEG